MANRWILTAGFLFAVAFQKYSSRDPLASAAGMQAVIEIGLTLLPCVIVIWQSRRMESRVGIQRALWFFMIYGVFAMASSIKSFSPTLSVVKAFLYFSVILMAYLLAELQQGIVFLNGVYRGYIATLIAALVQIAASPASHPLFIVDDYNGRTRLNLWTTHPNSIGEVSGLMFLLALVLPIRTRWYWQLFLLAINVAAGEKTSTGSLFLVLGIIFLFGTKDLSKRWRVALLGGSIVCAGVACIEVGVFPAPAALAGNAAQSIYGREVSNEVGGLDGRTELWSKAGDMATDCILLGFGFEGSRAYLLAAIPWAGQAHNGMIQALLSAGIGGLLALMIGWGCSVWESLAGDRIWKIRIIALNFYLFALAMVGPVFDSPSYLTMLIFVVIPYAAIDRQSMEAREATSETRQSIPALVKAMALN